MRDNFCFIIYFCCGLTLALSGCREKETPVQTNGAAAIQPEIASPATVPEKEKQIYVYSGDRFRDPFIASGQANSYQADVVFDPQKAIIKGIIFGPNQKSAFLTVGSGNSYYVKAGRIFDVMGKPVEGYSAKIFIDRVILVGEADNSFELFLKKKGDDEEDKK